MLQTPAVYGDKVVFGYAGDLWITHTSPGSMATRLTSHPGAEGRPRISPDGKWIAFTGQYDGPANVYVMPIEGGEPRRLTYGDVDACTGWTPDGKVTYITNSGNFTNRQTRLYIVDPAGGLPVATKLTEASDGTWLDKDTYVYNRLNSSGFNWRRYRGGSQGRVSIYNFAKNEYSELPTGREQNYYPIAVGRSVYFISDKKLGTLNLYRYDLDSKRESQLTQFNDADIRLPNSDGKTIVFQRDGYLWMYDIASGKNTKLSPRIYSDNLALRPALRSLGNAITGLTISPSGSRIAVEARGEIFSVPVKNGETRNITQSQGSRERNPNWSPDGKTISYMSDESGEYEIYSRPQMGGAAVQITNRPGFRIDTFAYAPDGKHIEIRALNNQIWLLELATKKLTKVVAADYGIGGTDWSPDGKYLAYSSGGRNQFQSIYIYEVASGKTVHVTDGYFSDSDVAFDGNGKYLYVISGRTFGPSFGSFEFSLKVDAIQRIYVLPLSKETTNPLLPTVDEEPNGPKKPPVPPSPVTKIDFDGLADRAIPLPLGNGNYSNLTAANDGVFYSTNGALFKFDLKSKQSTLIFQNLLGQFAFNAAKTKLAYNAAGVVGVVDVAPGGMLGAGRVDTSGVEAIIDPRQEFKQIFWETWRIQRDHFYDPTMGGQDWLAIGKHYAEYLPHISSRIDLFAIQGLLIGELGTGHEYLQPGDPWLPIPRNIPNAYLGVDYAVEGDNVKLAKIFRGLSFDESSRAPLNEPGENIKDGSYLLAIDGHKVDSHVNPQSLLVNKVGRTVMLTIADTAGGLGSRDVRVRPVGSEMNLRKVDFLEDNRKWVDKMSGGRIGYMYISDTQATGSIDFVRGYYSQTDRDAMIVDERWNGGGYIQPWFVDTLGRHIKAGIQNRTSKDASDAVAIEGPKAMLINGYAGSGGDFFPWMFKHEKLGPLIGKRTWGGLVGISGYYPLVDGGGVTSPSFAIYDRDTNDIIAENRGVDPDIDVDNRPDLVIAGHDPQLERALAYLEEQLKQHPPRKPRAEPVHVGEKGRVKAGG